MSTTQADSYYSKNKNNEEDEKTVLQPFNHFKHLPPRKDYVTKLWSAYNYWFQVPKDKLKEVSILGNELMDAVYIIDDLIDNSKMRRGILTAHLVYGSSRTIYSHIYATFLVMSKFHGSKVIENFIAASLNLFQGQAMEMYFTNNGICPSEEQYKQIVFNKTTSCLLFSLCLQQTFATKHKTCNFDKFITSLGLFSQVCNDYIGLVSRTNAKTKIFGEDITEGKFSFPMIHGIKTRPEDHRLMDILKQKTSDKNMKLDFIKLLEEFGSLNYTLKKLEELKNECVEEMRKVAANPEMEKVLDEALNNIEALVM